MIKKISSEVDLEKCLKIENSIYDTSHTLPEFIHDQDLKKILFFPEAFFLKFDLIRLLNINCNLPNKNIYLSYRKLNVTKYIQLLDIDENEWDTLLQPNNEFVNIVYSDFTCLFDESKEWFYFHKIDYPNILFTKNVWTIPQKYQKHIQPIDYILEEFGEETLLGKIIYKFI